MPSELMDSHGLSPSSFLSEEVQHPNEVLLYLLPLALFVSSGSGFLFFICITSICICRDKLGSGRQMVCLTTMVSSDGYLL